MENEFKIPMSKPNFGKEETDAILQVLKSDWPSQGKVTQEFETQLSNYLSSRTIAVNNGSSALMCSLLAHGLKPGDKVIVPAFTFVAPSTVAKLLGAQIIVADIDPDTLNVSPEIIKDLVRKSNAKFVIIVDIGGLPADIDSFSELSKRYDFTLIEDAAQGFGSEYKNKKLGSFEHTTIFSFQIAKQLTTIEGGCISTTNDKIIKKIDQIRDYGRNKTERYVHDVLGSNFRITDIQSAIGIVQLKKVEEHIARRNAIASEYKKHASGLNFQKIPSYVTRNSYMLFFALAKNKEQREKITNQLTKSGIDARKSFLPIHLQPCNPELSSTKCPNAEKVFDNVFTLPIYNSMTTKETQTVIESLNSIGNDIKNK